MQQGIIKDMMAVEGEAQFFGKSDHKARFSNMKQIANAVGRLKPIIEQCHCEVYENVYPFPTWTFSQREVAV